MIKLGMILLFKHLFYLILICNKVGVFLGNTRNCRIYIKKKKNISVCETTVLKMIKMCAYLKNEDEPGFELVLREKYEHVAKDLINIYRFGFRIVNCLIQNCLC